MFGFKKKKPEGFTDLQKVRDLLKELTGESMRILTGTVLGHLMNLGRTPEDVDKAQTEMLENLQKYVQAEILLDRQKNGHGPSLAELVFLRPECSYERPPTQAAEVTVPERA